MIIKEFFEYSDALQMNLYRAYSDKGLKIKQVETGNIYDEAVDVETANYSYEETDIPIEKEEE